MRYGPPGLDQPYQTLTPIASTRASQLRKEIPNRDWQVCPLANLPAKASRAVDILGGHPFYLQLFGEALTRNDPPYGDAALKSTLSELLFSNTGRLSLYFHREYDKIVGRATKTAIRSA
jgi:hypothetical protein